MPQLVTSGAKLQCSFGAALNLIVTPENRVNVSNQPVATITDIVPFKNLIPTPSGVPVCTSMQNPAVASATAAAMGVLTPQPCTPVIAKPWTPGSSKVKIANKPALTNTSTCNCAYGGVITITFSGQVTVNSP